MGATAITVLSGAHVLRLAPSLPAVEAVRPALEGLTFFLWAFGTWWFPFLFVLTAWRYAAPRGRAFDSSLWSMVFPLGMYGVATDTFGDAAHLPLLRSLASAEVWLALIAWAGVAAWMVASTRGGRGERSGDAARRAPA
jgi:tellurite resistance protein TehA-like permease